MNPEVANRRRVNESLTAYHKRLRHVASLIKAYLRGYPATHSSDGREYVVGPHKTHGPRPGLHCGTLVKYPKLPLAA